MSENIYALISAGVSFVVLGSFWRDHHALFERATGYTPLMLRINMLGLVGIVVMPLATVLDVYAHKGDRLAIGIYLGVMILTMSASRCCGGSPRLASRRREPLVENSRN